MSDIDSSTGKTPAVPQEIPEVDFKSLGYFLDGWADLVEGQGSKVQQVQQALVDGLRKRNITNLKTGMVNGYVAIYSSDRRKHLFSSLGRGIRTTVYLAQKGDDLYAAWKAFYSPQLNNGTLIILALLAGLFGIIIISNWEWLGFWGWIVSTIAAFLLELGLIEKAGLMLKGKRTAFLVTDPTLFDADDITALNLAIHKTLVRALDDNGIDISKLRLKPNFNGGRRDENV